MNAEPIKPSPHVGLFVTCPVDLVRPSVGFASVKLLEQAGCRVDVPPQSCCGQVAFNNGAPKETQQLAWRIVQDFDSFDYVVLPSGSCAAMMKLHYPGLFEGDPRYQRVKQFCEKVYELTCFLNDILYYQAKPSHKQLEKHSVTYHDSCAGLRELDIKKQPRQLLSQCANIELKEMQDTDVCCGFGGTFCVKFSDVSNKMVSNKVQNARETGVDLLLGGDLSCLLNIAGKIHRQQKNTSSEKPIQVRHIAEVLAGDLNTPAIGESQHEKKS
ncbi:MAG: (Fe-S)-binding protein [Spongiibacteraceae bacterium]|nr:(Fe-S)-binding protein [Spongiibacteraceae bacterium]